MPTDIQNGNYKCEGNYALSMIPKLWPVQASECLTVNGAQLNETSSCCWQTDWVSMLLYSSVATQQIIYDEIQFVLSVPWIVISVLAGFAVRRRVSSCFCVELYLTTAALGATLQNLVQIYNPLSFPSMCSWPSMSGRLVKYSLCHL